jgi:hypothetical protein
MGQPSAESDASGARQQRVQKPSSLHDQLPSRQYFRFGFLASMDRIMATISFWPCDRQQHSAIRPVVVGQVVNLQRVVNPLLEFLHFW